MNRVALSARDESHVHPPLGRGCERRLRTTQTLDRHISIGFCWFLCVWTCVRTLAEVNEWERGLEPTKTELSINHFSVNAFFQLCAVSGHTRWEWFLMSTWKVMIFIKQKQELGTCITLSGALFDVHTHEWPFQFCVNVRDSRDWD